MIIFFVICVVLMIVVSGCGKDHILDGPDMEYEPKWKNFTISKYGSVAQDNFSFTVTDDGENSVVTGTCIDREGNSYYEWDGISVPSDVLWKLRRLNLEMLETYVPSDISGNDEFEDIIILDGGGVTLTLELASSEVVEKIVPDNLPTEIYEILMPCFSEKTKKRWL